MSKIGTEILVNTQTLYDQTLSQIAKLNDGGFVLVWVDWADSTNTGSADGSWSGIKAQVFSANGSKTGAEISVNSAVINWQQDPRVAVLANGNFVVTWTDGWDYFSWADHPGSLGVGGAEGDTEGKAIKAQVFTADGAPIGTEILVNTEHRNSQTLQKIVALENGNFVVVWEDWVTSCSYDANGNLNSCGGGPAIRAQIMDSSGTKTGPAIAVSGNYQYSPQVSKLVGGGFVVVWHDGNYSVDDVRAQVFSPTGIALGDQILVNTQGVGPSFSQQNEEKVTGLANGGFVVTWTNLDGDGSRDYGVRSQVFDVLGAKVGAEIFVNTSTYANQYHPQTVALANGGFVVVWDNWGGDQAGGSEIDVNAQVFDNSGVRVGTEILVNTNVGGTQNECQVAALEDGGFTVSWGTYGTEIKMQVFDAQGGKIGPEVQVNSTTAGDQSGAQITALADTHFVIAWNENLYGPSDGSGGAVKAQVFSTAIEIVPLNPAGTADNDTLAGNAGNDTIDGGEGIDTVNYTQQRGLYSLEATNSGWTVNGPEGLDTLTNVERLQFADKKLALDLGATQNSGQAVKFIGALAYPLATDAGTFGLILGFFDQGYTLSSISDLAVSSGLTASLAGSGSNADLAKLVFRNVAGGEADAATTDMLVGFMDGRHASYTQGGFLAAVADLELNQEHVGLVGLQLTGLEYL